MHKDVNIELINADCMRFLKYMDDNMFDIAIVDPPYGIGMDKVKKSISKKSKHNRKGLL